MKKKMITVLAGVMIASFLGGCGIGQILGRTDSKTDDKEASGSESKTDADSPQTLELLGDLMGEELPDSDTDHEDSGYGSDAPENKTVVTRADEWQGLYVGTINVIGFGETYNGIEKQYDAYAVVVFPEEDKPFLEIYSEEFDVWNNYDFGYEGTPLISMYVDPSDTDLTPVVHEDGDAYVVDMTITEEEAQAFKIHSDGKNAACLSGQFEYVDPEALEDTGEETGLLMLFNMTKEAIDE